MSGRLSAAGPYVMDCERLAARVVGAQERAREGDPVGPRGRARSSRGSAHAAEGVDPHLLPGLLPCRANAGQTAWGLSPSVLRVRLRHEHGTDQDRVGALLARERDVLV